jgi:hypothetical protein
MRDWIAVIMAVLGVLLVLAGGTLLVLNALAAGGLRPSAIPPAPDETTTEVPVAQPTPAQRAPVTTRLTDAARRLPSADRLIGWGVVLLVLAAIAAGAITFNFQLAANSPR